MISAKSGTNYPNLELGNKLWNWDWVPGSWYKSLPYINH